MATEPTSSCTPVIYHSFDVLSARLIFNPAPLSVLTLASHAVGTAPDELSVPATKAQKIDKLSPVSSAKAPVVSATKVISFFSQVSAELIV